MYTIRLNDGNKMPNICFGTPIVKYDCYSLISFSKLIIKSILHFDFYDIRCIRGLINILKYINSNIDFMAIDTSRAYGFSEKVIGKHTMNDNKSFYIVTKVSNSDQYSGNIIKTVKESMKQLNVDKIDLLLMHWPVEGKYIDTWNQMIEIKKLGLCKSIGVCNFNIHHLEKLKKETKVLPAVNEIECHPLFTQNELRSYCQKNNIQVMAYTALARMDERLNKTCLVDIAKKYNKSIAQVVLKWHISINNVPIFNTSNLKTFKSNINIFDFNLTAEEINLISSININSRLRYDPDNCDFTKL